MSDKGIKLCREYLFRAFGLEDASYERWIAHRCLSDYYDLEHEQTREITDHLDKYIGYDCSEDIFEQDVEELAYKLDQVLKNKAKEVQVWN